MGDFTLHLRGYKQEGDFQHTYAPLQNLIQTDGTIVGFNTAEIEADLNNPISIECQPSYDGTVNLILNDDSNPPRLINSRFSKLEDNRFTVVNRNQTQQTNLYHEGFIDQQTRLLKNINNIPVIDLVGLNGTGQLKGGSYTFYIKYADDDYNKTDIAAESAQVIVFKGQLNKIPSISGTVYNEITNKAITLCISNLDKSYSKIYVYYTREFSDTNGVRMSEAKMLTKPYEIRNTSETITITGYEDITDISEQEVNIQYNLVTAAKTQTQVQNMLFLGNVQCTNLNIEDLQNLSYYVEVTLKQNVDGVGWINPKDYTISFTEDDNMSEYYNPLNVYYKLGYWPEEMYRLGIVYIMRDDSLSPVFNLRGCQFTKVTDINYKYNENDCIEVNEDDSTIWKFKNIPRDKFIDGNYLNNSFGVFRNPNVEIIDYNYEVNNEIKPRVKPLYYEISLRKKLKEKLYEHGVKGYFIVRQKRIPTIICQGLSVGIDRTSYVPMLYDHTNDGNKEKGYFTESFLNDKKVLTTTYEQHKVYASGIQGSGLLCVDANVIPTIKSEFNGGQFVLSGNGEITLANTNRHYYPDKVDTNSNKKGNCELGITYINSDIPLKYINNYAYSTKCGSAEDVSQFSYFDGRDLSIDNHKLLRGIWCPFLGVSGNLNPNTIYTVKIPNYTETALQNYFTIRKNDTSPFYAISNRYELNKSEDSTINVYRGDCFSNTVTIRMNRNFTDSEVPVNEVILDAETWNDNYKGSSHMVNGKDESTDSKKEKNKDKGDWTDINRADINTVPLGIWVTYKCLSNYNLGMRSIDTSHYDEMALMGSPREFYPVSDCNVNASHKTEESWLFNQGYGATVGKKVQFIADDVPYTKDQFDNRVMFSNIQVTGSFPNSYRVFQALDYQDIDRQFGAIVKLLPWNNNLLCVFEHGVGVIPVNEKALISTQSGQSIHMYGAGVLQPQVSVISPDFGTIWQESIIRTPLGVYGVDTYAKKIWRVTYQNGMETISDMKVGRFLNDFIKLSEMDKYPTIGLKNVKTHYNNYKGDVMFTFYNESKDTSWNLCFNERMNKWITRYSWTPLYSENIDNIFYSLDQKQVSVFATIYDNKNCMYGIKSSNSIYTINDLDSTYKTEITASDYSQFAEDYNLEIVSVETSYLDSNDVLHDLIMLPSEIDANHEFPFTTIGHYITTISYSKVANWFTWRGVPHVPVYYKININVINHWTNNSISKIPATIGLVLDYKNNTPENWNDLQNVFLRNGFYIHGKAGIVNDINYEDAIFTNQILPTKWYDKQEEFEFEFIVNEGIGLHKIFNNLVIISNNVQPKQLSFEIEGDVYAFNKAGIFRSEKFGKDDADKQNILWGDYNKAIKNTYTPGGGVDNTTEYKSTQKFENAEVLWDTHTNSYSLLVTQDCKNIKEYGRRMGNIEYKEDSWYTNIEPILFNEKFKITGKSETEWSELKSTRIRDKYVKIRVKYTGTDLVIITALKTMLTLSYA